VTDARAAQDRKRLFGLLKDVKLLAREYYELTGKPLGVTAEIAEYEAARHLDMELAPARQPGYDAIRKTTRGNRYLQIKSRCLASHSKPGQRLGAIDLDKPWDAVLLVLLDEHYNLIEIHEADRSAVRDALTAPGSKARNERGQLGVSKFKSIGKKIWPTN
jgi:hypothetical protein